MPYFRASIAGFCLALILAAPIPVTAEDAEIPFVRRGGLMRVGPVVAGHQGAFVFDTGAEESVIALRFARKVGLRLVGKETVRGVGGFVDAHRTAPVTLAIGGQELTKSFLAIDLGAAGRSSGARIDGLVGCDLLARITTNIDFERSTIVLSRSGGGHRKDLAGYRACRLPLRTSTGAPCVQAAFGGGETAWLRLDTGCTGVVELAASGLGREADGGVAIGLGVRRGVAKSKTLSLELGAFLFENLRVSCVISPAFPGESGLIGTGLLNRFQRVVIDPSAGTVAFAIRR